MTPFRSGFVALVGPTNSGKSTLLNRLVNQKVSIVSKRVQTTYHQVRGILNRPHSQIVFVDTPGYQSGGERMAQLLNKVADQAAQSCENWVWILDASNPKLLSQIETIGKRVSALGEKKNRFCVLNKVDKVAKGKLLPVLKALSDLDLFAELIPISALTGDGVELLANQIEKTLPEGPALFPDDMVTDRNEQFMVTEYIREKIYWATLQEVPYTVRIEIETWENKNEITVIHAVIHVDSVSRKKILVGRGGEMLKRIGTEARKDIETLVGRKVFLQLFVHVDPQWTENRQSLETYIGLTQ